MKNLSDQKEDVGPFRGHEQQGSCDVNNQCLSTGAQEGN